MSRRKYRELVEYRVQCSVIDDPAGSGLSKLDAVKNAVREAGGSVSDDEPRPKIVRVPIDEGGDGDEDGQPDEDGDPILPF